jgi:hypothetical protein
MERPCIHEGRRASIISSSVSLVKGSTVVEIPGLRLKASRQWFRQPETNRDTRTPGPLAISYLFDLRIVHGYSPVFASFNRCGTEVNTASLILEHLSGDILCKAGPVAVIVIEVIVKELDDLWLETDKAVLRSRSDPWASRTSFTMGFPLKMVSYRARTSSAVPVSFSSSYRLMASVILPNWTHLGNTRSSARNFS